MTTEAQKKKAAEKAKAKAGSKEPEKPEEDIKVPETSEIKTVDDLESQYPDLVSEIRDDVITQIGACPVKDLKANMPELYERIAADVPKQGGIDLREPGFLLDIGDPFAAGALRTYARLRNLVGLHLPFVLPFKSKGRGDIRAEAWKKKYEASEALKAEFKKVDAYVAFKSKVVTQALEHYIQIADGAGDRERVAAARKAMTKIK